VEEEVTLPVNALLAIVTALHATNVESQVTLLVIVTQPLKRLEVFATTAAAEATLPENVPTIPTPTASVAVLAAILQEIAPKSELILPLAIATIAERLDTLLAIALSPRTINLLLSKTRGD